MRLNAFWHEAKFRLIERIAMPGKHDRVLDAGCGSGTISHFFISSCGRGGGYRQQPIGDKLCNKRLSFPNAEFRLGQFEDLMGDKPFDRIYCIEVIEHLYEQQVADLLSPFNNLTNPGDIGSGISSLTASTTYHFRVVASNTVGTAMGSDTTFATLSATGAPVVTSGSATSVTSSSATLNGSLDPHGLTTTVSFQWGTTTSYGHTTAMQSQTGNTYRNIAANISGLTTHTTYHFRIVATNSAGARMGSDKTFTTP